MSLSQSRTTWGLTCFPRVSGDEPAMNVARLFVALFSPRERG